MKPDSITVLESLFNIEKVYFTSNTAMKFIKAPHYAILFM